MILSKYIFLIKKFVLEKKILILLSFCFLAIRVILFINLDIWAEGGDDAVTRTYQAFTGGSFHPTRLPFHSYAMSFFMNFGGDPIFISKLFSLFFGFLTFMCFFCLVRRVFDEKIAFLSLLFLCFYSMHSLLSVIPMTQSFYLFLLIGAILLIKKYKTSHRLLFLAVASFLLGLSCLVRYESWILVIVLTLYIAVYNKMNLRDIFLFFIISSSFPLAWLFFQWKYTGSPFTFAIPDLVMRMPSSQLQYLSLKRRIFYWFGIIYKESGLIPICFLIYGFVLSFLKTRNRLFLFLFVVLFLIPFVGMLTNIAGMNRFYIINSQIFLIPFIFFGLLSILKNFKFRKQITIIVLIIVICHGSLNAAELVKKYKPSIDFQELIVHVKKQKIEKGVLVTRTLFSGCNLGVDTPLDLLCLYVRKKNFDNMYMIENKKALYGNIIAVFRKEKVSMERGSDSATELYKQLSGIININKPGLAIFSSEDNVLKIFNDRNVQKLWKIVPEAILENSSYKMYRINYVKS